MNVDVDVEVDGVVDALQEVGDDEQGGHGLLVGGVDVGEGVPHEGDVGREGQNDEREGDYDEETGQPLLTDAGLARYRPVFASGLIRFLGAVAHSETRIRL